MTPQHASLQLLFDSQIFDIGFAIVNNDDADLVNQNDDDANLVNQWSQGHSMPPGAGDTETMLEWSISTEVVSQMTLLLT